MVAITRSTFHKGVGNSSERTAVALEFIARIFGEMSVTQQEMANNIEEIKNQLKNKK